MNSSSFEPATEQYVSLATYRRNGAEVKTPVWIAGVAERYYADRNFKPPVRTKSAHLDALVLVARNQPYVAQA
jgi:hypothetical protein